MLNIEFLLIYSSIFNSRFSSLFIRLTNSYKLSLPFMLITMLVRIALLRVRVVVSITTNYYRVSILYIYLYCLKL